MSETTPTPSPEAPAPPSDIEQVRQLILATHTDIVPDLVQGTSVTELVASIQHAREAYSNVLASAPAPTVTIPAGGNTPVTFDLDALPTSEKLRRGLAATRKD